MYDTDEIFNFSPKRSMIKLLVEKKTVAFYFVYPLWET